MGTDGIHFRRQHAIGKYIVDFCAPRKKLIIELDGSQHLEQRDYDAERTQFLEAQGYRVLRFWNSDVINTTDAVLQVIWNALNDGNET
jgi:very-short-patch-repair endonuclease